MNPSLGVQPDGQDDRSGFAFLPGRQGVEGVFPVKDVRSRCLAGGVNPGFLPRQGFPLEPAVAGCRRRGFRFFDRHGAGGNFRRGNRTPGTRRDGCRLFQGNFRPGCRFGFGRCLGGLFLRNGPGFRGGRRRRLSCSIRPSQTHSGRLPACAATRAACTCRRAGWNRRRPCCRPRLREACRIANCFRHCWNCSTGRNGAKRDGRR